MFDSIRDDHPGTFRALLVLAIMTATTTSFLLLPDLPVLRVMGVTAAQQRIKALGKATYWAAKAITRVNEKGVQAKTLYGNIEGVSEDGQVIVAVPSGAQWSPQKFQLADIAIVDKDGHFQQINALRFADAKIVVFNDQRAIISVHGEPLNVMLVANGTAVPQALPVTDIADAVLATHYWNIATGSSGAIPH